MTLTDYHPLYIKIPRVHTVNGEEGKALFFFFFYCRMTTNKCRTNGEIRKSLCIIIIRY